MRWMVDREGAEAASKIGAGLWRVLRKSGSKWTLDLVRNVNETAYLRVVDVDAPLHDLGRLASHVMKTGTEISDESRNAGCARTPSASGARRPHSV